MTKNQIFNIIAENLLAEYISVYYVNAENWSYQWFTVDAENHTLNPEKDGKDIELELSAISKINLHFDF